jgi:hypothetical protein
MLTLLDARPSRAYRPAMSISLSKWPMFATIALSFIFFMWASVITFLLPVAVMKMSAAITSSSVVTW